jgi:beta-mannosidase
MNYYPYFRFIFCFLLVLQISCTNKPNVPMNTNIELNENWSLQMEGDSTVYPAKVPGTVQTDLLLNNKIPQPFYRDNEKKYQWIDKENWNYSTHFNIDSIAYSSDRIFLDFKGLDTYATVLLNGNRILDADNFYRSWRIGAKKYLRVGENNLEIQFQSPIKKGLEKLNLLGYALPAANDQSEVGELGENKVSVFTRKAPYHYGWDWGPRFVTMGIWRPVFLEFRSGAEITGVYYQQQSVTSKKAVVVAKIDVSGYKAGSYTFIIRNEDENQVTYGKKEIKLNENSVHAEIKFTIEEPDLWWPNGYGKSTLYAFRADIMHKGRIIDSKTTHVGLRDIKVIRKNDSNGQSFYFQVNDVPIFAKGANYIPNDNFLPHVSNEKYKYMVKSAYEANMNMLRVWGGGIYENDIFYELCDKYGILVWQDFMYACSMYPGDDAFLENARLEAVENVKRLRNHASIALWCGNNEIDAAWCEEDEQCGWGWKQLYNAEQRKQIWHAYDTLFHKLLPAVIHEYSPTSFYWPSSPLADWGKTASYSNKSGDMHYWGVWHGSEPFEKFEDVVPRFMSEYGFQSFPEFNTINEFTLPEDWDIYSEVMLSHQRSPIGNQKIREYMELYYKVPDDFKEFLYVGQVLQAFGIEKAIDVHRMNKPFCMGSLYWQLNDCWPGASWSGIDYYGNWKALHYRAKEAFKKTRIGIWQSEPEDQLRIYVLNDDQKLKEAVIQLNIRNFSGEGLFQNQQTITFSFDSATTVATLDLSHMPVGIDRQKSYLEAKLVVGDTTLDQRIHFFVLPKKLKLQESAINFEIEEKANTYQIKLASPHLEKDVFISVPGVGASFSDNYFDMLPGETKVVDMKVKSSQEGGLDKKIVIRTMNMINNSY